MLLSCKSLSNGVALIFNVFNELQLSKFKLVTLVVLHKTVDKSKLSLATRVLRAERPDTSSVVNRVVVSCKVDNNGVIEMFKVFNELHPVTSNVEILVVSHSNNCNADKPVTPLSVERRVLLKQVKLDNELHPVTSNVDILVVKHCKSLNVDKPVTPLSVERRVFSKQYKVDNGIQPVTSNVEILVTAHCKFLNVDSPEVPSSVESRVLL